MRYNSLTIPTKVLIGANLLAGLYIGVSMLSGGSWSGFSTGGSSESMRDAIRMMVLQRAQNLSHLINSELDGARSDASSLADSATQIFANPESFLLAPQPSEYDRDLITGTYGSVRNDGSSALVLSAASTLNPEILREIRLSEYLNSGFRTLTTLNGIYRDITLYTTDGLVRSFPWLDFRKAIAAGRLKRDFSVLNLPWFNKVVPSKNPHRVGICGLASGGLIDEGIQWFCSAPFFAGESFRGVISVSIDSTRMARKLFSTLGPKQGYGLFLQPDGVVFAMSEELEGLLDHSGANGPFPMEAVKISSEPALEKAIRRLGTVGASASYSSRIDGFYLAASSVGQSLGSVALLLPEAQAETLIGAEPKTNFRWHSGVMASVLLVLLILNTRWLVKARSQSHRSSKELSSSLTALADLNLTSALAANQPALTSAPDLPPDDEIRVIKLLPEAPEPDGDINAGADWSLLSHQLSILSSLEVGDSISNNISRLSSAISSMFGVGKVGFFSFSTSGSFRQLPWAAGAAEWKEGLLFANLVENRRIVSSNTTDLEPPESEILQPFIDSNYLAGPLLDNNQLVGALVLSDKESEFSIDDELLMLSIQGTLAKALKRLCQYEGFLQLDSLRREYCLELSEAVEAPLNRIRVEVQTIYSRLGKLTPYYKQHCETILFEIGKLYEMVREVREADAKETGASSADSATSQ